MNFDISQLLEQWDYQPGQVVVRKFKAKDGSEKIQLRVDLGILQMNVHGRPDGKRPLGHESLFEHYVAQLKKHRTTHAGSDVAFALKAEDCTKLQQEAIQYHHRYICLFQLEEFDSVVRDAERNLELFDFVSHFAEVGELAWSLEQFRPQLLMMHTRAKGALALKSSDYPAAMTTIEAGMDTIRDFYRKHSRHDLLEQSGELHSLETWLEEIRTKRPRSEREQLEHDLHDAVTHEDYEKAAQLRDALRNLKA